MAFNLPAIQYPQNALLDFSPVTNALNRYQQASEAAYDFGVAKKAGEFAQKGDHNNAALEAFKGGLPDLGAKFQGLHQSQQQAQREAREYFEKKLAAAYQMVDKMPAERRDAAHDMIFSRISQAHPEAAKAFQSGFNSLPEVLRNDRATQRAFVIASALGPKDPLQQKAIEASIYKDTQQGRLAGVNADTAKYLPYDPQKPLLNTKTEQFVKPPPNIDAENPYEAALKKKEAEKTGELTATRKNEIVTNAQGANEFMQQQAYLKALIAQAAELEKNGGGAVFGPISGKEGYQYWRGINPLGDKKALDLQQQIKATLSNMELAVAKLKLKGTGTVTENERAIARNTIGSLLSYDTDTANKVLGALDAEARDALKKHGDFERFGQRYVESNAYLNPNAPKNAPIEVRQIPPDAVRMLQRDPSPQAIQEFEAIFGKGSAKQFLRQ